MRRLLLTSFAAFTLAMGAACTPEGVGDPCEPESCPPEIDPETGEPTGRCGWQSEEVYLEHFSLQCRTRVCMVFRPQEGIFDPYCTRRCGPGAAIKGCGEKYTCMEVVTGSGAGQGCYCVHKDQINAGPGTTDQDKIDACK